MANTLLYFAIILEFEFVKLIAHIELINFQTTVEKIALNVT